MRPELLRVVACFLGCGLCVLLAAALVPQPAPARPPVPDVAGELERLVRRVDALAARDVHRGGIVAANARILAGRRGR